MRNNYELVIFDWDGTLMDSEAKIIRCFEQAMADVGLASPGASEIRQIIGLGLKEAITQLLPEASDQTGLDVAGQYRQHFLHYDQTPMEFFPNVRENLRQLASHGYMMAVATGKARRGLDRILKEWDMETRFVATRCADEAFSKPHPRMLEDLLQQTGISAQRAIMVGDTTFDMEMASNAGAHGLAVSYGAHDREQLLAYAPQACVDSFDEVRAWLMQGQNPAA
ncbi:MAG: HAD-IA family hydrolase [Gammaproteobacteria bacterium]|nr:MAG: HAD-IA family hydrolase [Gammaproteobacteria bacterium]